jgi:hypothetical protein
MLTLEIRELYLYSLLATSLHGVVLSHTRVSCYVASMFRVKTETVRSIETLGILPQHNPEDLDLNLHRRENSNLTTHVDVEL